MAEMLLGAALMLAGMLAGRFLPSRRKTPKSPEPVCGCGHHRSYHDPQTGACHGTHRRTLYSEFGSDRGVHDIPCTCRQYSGPVPLPEFYAPEIGQ